MSTIIERRRARKDFVESRLEHLMSVGKDYLDAMIDAAYSKGLYSRKTCRTDVRYSLLSYAAELQGYKSLHGWLEFNKKFK